MTERKRGSEQIVSFSFLCPKGREKEVIEIFKKESFGSLNPVIREGVRSFFDPQTGEITSISGSEIQGVTDERRVGELRDILVEEGIAGYSRETQIIVQPLLDEDF
jgi:hypothetical protein